MPRWQDAPVIGGEGKPPVPAAPSWQSAPVVDGLYDSQASPPPSHGMHAALAGASGLSATPWHSQGMFGGRGPSVRDAISALPAAGGIVGAALAAPTGPAAVGGAALGGAAGESLRQLAQRAIGAGGPATSAEAAGGVLLEGAVQGGAEAFGRGLGAGMKGGAKKLMQSAVKPTESLLREFRTTAPRLAKTLLEEGARVSRGGLKRLEGLLTAKNEEITAAISGMRVPIQKKAVLSRLDDVRAQFGKQVAPQADLAEIETIGKSFAEHPTYTKPFLTPSQAQELKVGTYRTLKKKYGQAGPASIEAEKALARGLKEELAEAVPQIGELNSAEAQLMAARNAVQHAVNLAERRDPVGFAWVTNHPTTFLAALIERQPVVKSMLAQGMWKSAGAATRVTPQLIRAAVLALVAKDDETARSSDGSSQE